DDVLQFMAFGVGVREVLARERVALVLLQRDDPLLVLDHGSIVHRLDVYLDRADLAARTATSLLAVPAAVAVRHVVGNGHGLGRILGQVLVRHLAQHVVHVRTGGHSGAITIFGRELDGHTAVLDRVGADRALAFTRFLVDDAAAILAGHEAQAVAVHEAVAVLLGGDRVLAVAAVLAADPDGGAGPVAVA